MLILTVFITKNAFALEEINFPDITYIVTDSGEWIEKEKYLKTLEKDLKKNKEDYIIEEISFPDITYIVLDNGEWIEKNEYEKKIKKNIVNGYATYYGDPSSNKFHGKQTASGEIFDRNLMTAAMNNIKLGTVVKVTNKANNNSVIVKINDRMGATKSVIDLSYGAFKKIADIKTGRILVDIEILNN